MNDLNETLSNILESYPKISKYLKKEYVKEGKLQSKLLTTKSVFKKFPHLRKYFDESNYGFKEILFCLFNDLDKIPICPICGKNLVVFNNYTKGFKHTCSKECSLKYRHMKEENVKYNSNIRNKYLNFLIEHPESPLNKYDIVHDSSSTNNIIVKNYCEHGDIKLSNKTFNKLISMNDFYNNSICIECNKKIYESYNPTYNDIITFQNNFKEFYDKHSLAMKLNWWLTYYPKRLKILVVYFQKYFDNKPIEEINLQEMCYVFLHKLKNRPTCKKENCTNKVEFSNETKSYNVFCNEHYINYNAAGKELELEDFIQSLNLKYVHNERRIIDKELDFYFPIKKIAIEFNGCWFHSNKFKDIRYHANKWVKCNDKGVSLITIWEDDWLEKQDIVISIIKSKFGIYEHIVKAKQCEINKVENITTRNFMNDNHLKGYAPYKWCYGLFYNDELVMMLCIGEIPHKINECNIVRVCAKIGWNVKGGVSKMLNYFLDEHPKIKVITGYADKAISQGNMYKALGFKYVGDELDWAWLHNGKRINRYNKIKKHAKELNLYKCYGCGMMKYMYNIE